MYILECLDWWQWWSRVWIWEDRQLSRCARSCFSARLMEMLHPLRSDSYDSSASMAVAVGVCNVCPQTGEKVVLRSLLRFKMMDQRDFPMGEAFEQLRLLVDAFPVICYMKKEAKWAKALKNKIEKIGSKQPGRPIFVALPRTLACLHWSN